MPALNVITSAGGGQLEKEAVQAFRKTMRWQVLSRTDAGYDEVRKIWNELSR